MDQKLHTRQMPAKELSNIIKALEDVRNKRGLSWTGHELSEFNLALEKLKRVESGQADHILNRPRLPPDVKLLPRVPSKDALEGASLAYRNATVYDVAAVYNKIWHDSESMELPASDVDRQRAAADCGLLNEACTVLEVIVHDQPADTLRDARELIPKLRTRLGLPAIIPAASDAPIQEVDPDKRDAVRYRLIRSNRPYVVRLPDATIHCGGHMPFKASKYGPALDKAVDEQFAKLSESEAQALVDPGFCA